MLSRFCSRSLTSRVPFIIRAVATAPEGIIDKDVLERAINKKPNKHYHILSTRVGTTGGFLTLSIIQVTESISRF